MSRTIPTFLLATTIAACLPVAQAPQPSAPAIQMGPSHPPTTAEQWRELEARAASLAQADAMKIALSEQLTKQGMMVGKQFAVSGGHCYRAGIVWAFGGRAHVSVMYQRRSDGRPVNDSVGGARGNLENGAGVLEFCADRDGEAALTVSALGANGAIANDELLEYAFALGTKVETPGDASARKAKDRAAGEQARANIEANIAAAEARERRDLEERCTQCAEKFRACQVRNAYGQRANCEGEFELCAAGGYSRRPEDMQRCGPAPR